MSRWKFIAKPSRGGYRFFEDLESGRIAVADNSGAEPHLTDDGILWLNFERFIQAGRNIFLVPVIMERNAQEVTIGSDAEEALWVANSFGIPIETEHKIYQAVEVSKK